MSDNNIEDDTGAATAEKGSSSECSDISIEKLNAEEPEVAEIETEVAEIKSTEDDDKVFSDSLKSLSNIFNNKLYMSNNAYMAKSIIIIGRRRYQCRRVSG